MKRRHLVSGLALTLITLAGAQASAQTPTQPPPNQPPSTGTPSQPPEPTTPAPAAGTNAVRVHIRTEKDKGTARVYIHRTNDQWTSICTAPCTVDVPVNAELRATYNDNDEDPHTFAITGEYGPEVDLIVKPPSVGPLIGGIVTMGAGGVFVVSGLLFIAIADLNKSVSTSNSSTDINKSVSDVYKTTGYVCIGLGAAAVVAGLIWLTTRSKEPRTTEVQHNPGQVYNKASTFLSDVASAKHDAPITVKPMIAPLQYTLTF